MAFGAALMMLSVISSVSVTAAFSATRPVSSVSLFSAVDVF